MRDRDEWPLSTVTRLAAAAKDRLGRTSRCRQMRYCAARTARRCLRGASRVPMMQSANQRQLDHLPRCGRFHCSRFWRVLAEREMRAAPMIVVVNKPPQQAPQVCFIEHDNMIQQFSPEPADHALRIRILPRGAARNDDFPDAQVLHSAAEACAVDAVAITQQVPWRTFPRERLDQLLARPLRRRVSGYVDAEDAPPIVCQYDKYEEYVEEHGRNHE